MSTRFSADHPLPFLDHLEALRQTLFRCLAAFAIGFSLALPLTPHIINTLKAPLAHNPHLPATMLQSIQVTGAFRLTVQTAALTGLALASPFILFFAGRFVFPGLTPRERALSVRALGVSLLLFICGVLIAYHATLALAIEVMLRFHHWLAIQPGWTINSYISFCLSLLLAFGLAFQLPVIILLLGYLGILTPARLRARRPHVIVALLVLSMILTPPDILTQLMLALPLILLYELCIWILCFTQRNPTNH
jgi:sec-independent protein translocase protein TatC